MQTGVFSTSSGYLRWRSRSERFALPYITTSGTSSQWAAGNLQLAHDIAATSSCRTGARASSRFAGHFTPAKAVLPVHRPSRTSSLVSLLRSILFSMSSVSSSHTETPNQSMKPTAPLRYNFSVFATTPWISSRCPASLVRFASARGRTPAVLFSNASRSLSPSR